MNNGIAKIINDLRIFPFNKSTFVFKISHTPIVFFLPLSIQLVAYSKSIVFTIN